NTFDIDGSALTVNGQDIFLADVDSLTLTGKTGADTFAVAAVPTYAVMLQGAGGQDRLVGPDPSNTWKITSNDAGTLGGTVASPSVENPTGGSADDPSALPAGKMLNGQIDGGAGANTLDYSAYKTAVTVNLQSAVMAVTGTKGVRNIGTVVGGGGLD